MLLKMTKTKALRMMVQMKAMRLPLLFLLAIALHYRASGLSAAGEEIVGREDFSSASDVSAESSALRFLEPSTGGGSQVEDFLTISQYVDENNSPASLDHPSAGSSYPDFDPSYPDSSYPHSYPSYSNSEFPSSDYQSPSSSAYPPADTSQPSYPSPSPESDVDDGVLPVVGWHNTSDGMVVVTVYSKDENRELNVTISSKEFDDMRHGEILSRDGGDGEGDGDVSAQTFGGTFGMTAGIQFGFVGGVGMHGATYQRGRMYPGAGYPYVHYPRCPCCPGCHCPQCYPYYPSPYRGGSYSYQGQGYDYRSYGYQGSGGYRGMP